MQAYPLTKANRLQLARAFMSVRRVDLSIDCLLEGQMGQVFVDDEINPSAFLVMVGPFLYLAGDASRPGAGAMLQKIPPNSIWMPSAPGWLEAAQKILPGQLVAIRRFSYSSQHLSLEHLRHLLHASSLKADVQEMDLVFAHSIWEQDHFVDLSNFDSPKDFIQRGIGFYLGWENKTIGAAFSSLVCSKGVEVSVFVVPEFRKQGIATTLASALLVWCLNNRIDPHWDAANSPSCALAEKLGYIRTVEYCAYYLKES